MNSRLNTSEMWRGNAQLIMRGCSDVYIYSIVRNGARQVCQHTLISGVISLVPSVKTSDEDNFAV